MLTTWLDWSFLVHLGAISQIVGFFFRDQIVLRLLVIIGSMFYVLYYFLFPAEPLWGATFWSVALGGTNIFMLVVLLKDRYISHDNVEEAQLFRVFTGFTPGMF